MAKWRPFTLEESIRFVLAASAIRDNIDREAGELLLAAYDNDDADSWGSAHDRLNVIGEFKFAETIRGMFHERGWWMFHDA